MLRKPARYTAAHKFRNEIEILCSAIEILLIEYGEAPHVAISSMSGLSDETSLFLSKLIREIGEFILAISRWIFAISTQQHANESQRYC